ncbi:MAG: hypothetical protein NDJ92_10360 [Thermoanaerobaculia bacterium]|nr:hypothetical protein [Thermoanaerobaculia bacterium]
MLRRSAAIVLALLLPSVASAWTPEAEERIASRSSRLAPPDLRLLIEKYSDEYRDGVRRASDPVECARHRYLVSRGKGELKALIERDVAEAIRLMKKERQVAAFVERLGRISHLVADANNPFHTDDSNPKLRESQADFEAYLGRKIASFPTVFYGLRINRDVPRYVDGILLRSASHYPLLDEEYFRGGRRRTSWEFDDRSTAFGVASISYSRAVTDNVNLYYYIWREAGGDVRSAAVLKKGNLVINDAAR